MWPVRKMDTMTFDVPAGFMWTFCLFKGTIMQDTDNKAPVEPMPPSPSSSYTMGRSLLTIISLAPGAGLVASLMAVVVMLLLRVAAGIPTPFELFGDFVLKHI